MSIVLVLLSGCGLERSVNTMQLDMNVLKRDVARIKQDMKNLNDNVSLQFSGYKKDVNGSMMPFRGTLADLIFRIDELHQEIQRLGGQIEELEYELKRENEALVETTSFLDEKVTILLEGLSEKGAIPVELQKKVAKVDLKETTKKGSSLSVTKDDKTEKEGKKAPEDKNEEEQRLYNDAKDLLLTDGNLPEARGKFKLFLKLYKASELAPNAQYWIGETYYGEKRFAEAIIEFDKVLKDYHESNKVPDAILKQGLAFYQLGDKDSYQLLLKKLIQEYPRSEAARIAKGKITGNP